MTERDTGSIASNWRLQSQRYRLLGWEINNEYAVTPSQRNELLRRSGQLPSAPNDNVVHKVVVGQDNKGNNKR